MNLSKYVYVSPQQFISAFKEWRYDYVIDGVIKRSASFGYHQGKDVFRKIEREAWRVNREVRKLNRWEWDALCRELHDRTYLSLEGEQIRFFSAKQKQRFLSEVNHRNAQVKIIRQFTDGDIVLHHIFEDDGRLLGFAIIIGPRGGYKTIHGFSVDVDDSNQPYLVREYEPCLQLDCMVGESVNYQLFFECFSCLKEGGLLGFYLHLFTRLGIPAGITIV